MRKIWLAAVLAGVLAAVPAAASDSLFTGSDGKISGYSGDAAEVTVPAELDGEAVRSVDVPRDDENVVSAAFSDGIVVLETGTLWYCANLEEIIFPESLEVIGESVAAYAENLQEVTIPGSVKLIGADAFDGCSALAAITFEGHAPLVTAAKAFEDIAEDAVFYVPSGCEDEYREILPDGAEIQTTGAEAVVYETELSDFFVDSEGVLTEYLGRSAVVEIPAEVDGTPVTAVGDEVFRHNLDLCAVVIPEGVTHIGESAFEETNSMQTVRLPSTVRSIGARAFKNCGAADVIPDLYEGLETISDEAFSHSRFEGELYLPEGLRSIGADAFNYSGLSEVYFPESIESVGDRAFYNSRVNYVVFALETLPEMGEDVFGGDVLQSLEDVDLPWDASRASWLAAKEYFDSFDIDGLTVWRANPSSAGICTRVPLSEGTYEDGLLTSYSGSDSDLTVFTAVDGVRVVGLGEGVFAGNESIRSFYPHHCDWFTTIGREAFADSSLEYIEMYDSITMIEEGAFRNCVNLKEIILPELLTEIAADAFDGCTGLEKIVVNCDPAVIPAELLENTSAEILLWAEATDEQVAVLSALMGRSWYDPVLREGEEPHGLIAMPDTDFTPEEEFEINEEGMIKEYLGSAERVVIPRTINGIEVTSIGYGAFMSQEEYGPDDEIPANTTLKEVIIPETVRTISSMAFLNTTALESVTCYGPIETMEEMAFADSGIQSIAFVNGLYEIGSMAFQNAASLKQIDFGGHVEIFRFSAFRNTGLEEMHIPATVTKIEQSAFFECAELTAVCFETADTEILADDQAFAETGITQVNLPEDASEDAVNMFYNKLNSWNSGPLTDKSQIVVGGCTHGG